MAKRRINWKRVRTLLLGLTAVILAAVGTVFSVQQWRQHRQTYYTDGVTIREPATSAQPREILWQPPRALDAPINTVAEEYEPKLTADGETMYFVRGRPGGNADLFTSMRTLTPTGEQWSEPQPLDALNTLDDELGPQPTFDGRSLLFYSNRSGGFGGYDLWITHRGDDGEWSPPENLDEAVNSEHNEYSPSLAPDSRFLVFASNRPRYGQATSQPDKKWPATVRERSDRMPYDLFIARVDDEAVSDAQRIDALNSPRNEGTPAFSPAGDFLYFASDRTGLGGSYDLFRSRILRGEFQPPEDLGPSVNTPSNELDPALSLGGFAMHFSSDRPIDVADQRGKPNYNIFATQSREVFPEVDHAAAAIDWAGLWETFAPSLLWLLLLLLALILLLAMMRGMKSRRLSLIAKCLLGSLIAHLVIMMLLSFWQVSVGVADMIRRGGAIKIALLPSSGSSDLVAQVRGGLTDVEFSTRLEASQRQQNESAVTPEPLALVSLTELTMTEIGIDASSAVREKLAESDPSSAALPPTIVAAAPAGRLEPPAVDMPALEAAEQQSEVSLTPTSFVQPPNAGNARNRAMPAPTLSDPKFANLRPSDLQATRELDASSSLAKADQPSDSPTRPSDASPIATALVPLPIASAAPRDITDTRLPDAATPTAELGEAVPSMQVANATSARAEQSMSLAVVLPSTIGESRAMPPSAAIGSTRSLVAATVPAAASAPPSSSGAVAAAPIPLPLPSSSPLDVSVARMPEAAANASPQSEPSTVVGGLAASDGAAIRPDLPASNQPLMATGPSPTSAPTTSFNASTSMAAIAAPNASAAPSTSNEVVMNIAASAAEMPSASPVRVAIPGVTEAAPAIAQSSEAATIITAGAVSVEGVSRPDLPAVDSSAPIGNASPSSTAAATSISATSSLATSTINDSAKPMAAWSSPSAPAAGPIPAALPSASLATTDALAMPGDNLPAPGEHSDERELRIAGSSSGSAATRAANVSSSSHSPLASATAMLDPASRDLDLPSSSTVAHDLPVPRDAVALLTGDAQLRDITRDPELPPLSGLNLDVQIPTEVGPPPAPTQEYVQRTPEKRAEAVEKFGGSEETEKSVASALAWLARHQNPDGRWGAVDFDDGCDQCGGKARFDTDIATTGLALLCFLGADHTHMKEGPYQDRVVRGLAWLKQQQRENGDLRGPETMYSHGIAAIALSEAYGMTGDPDLRDPVQRAINFIASARNHEMGGWRYEPGQLGDTSVLGWQVMAMVSAKRAGLEVPQDALHGAQDWLQSRVNQRELDGLYAYQPGQRHSVSMTAEGMFVLQLLGAKRDEHRMRNSAEFVRQNPPRWNDEPNTYYWYYATMAMFQHQGGAWDEWNEAIKRQLLDNQRRSGPAAGSWDPLDNWSKIGGRVYQTAICTLSLEVYYRYLPLYAKTED